MADPDLPPTGFLAVPETTPAVQSLYDDDLEGDGYVMNLTKVWTHQPENANALFDLIGTSVAPARLTFRQRGVLVTACASTLGDAYCSLAWGARLAGEVGPAVTASVLGGDDGPLDEGDRALAAWARKVADDPNGTTAADVQSLRDAGFDDDQIFAITFFVALRLAFSTVNDALGARPDTELAQAAPPEVLGAVSYGRPPTDVTLSNVAGAT